MLILLVLFLAALWAGAQNAVAGGGSFLTLPALMLSGLDARAANITSTIAMFPGQLAAGWAGRGLVGGVEGLSVRALVIISLIGGGGGGLLLLATPSDFFELLLPWLVLFATALFAWGSFLRRADAAAVLGPWAAGSAQFCISIYGGYFGGGIGFLMLASLTLTGMAVRAAGATKNLLAAMMNASAVVIFLVFSEADWVRVSVVAVGAVGGGLFGTWALHRVNERALRVVIVVIGLCLTLGLFIRQIAASTAGLSS